MIGRILEYITNSTNSRKETIKEMDIKINKLKGMIKGLEEEIKEKEKIIRGMDIKIKERKYIYVIKQEGDRYYIGVTNNIEKRYNEHMIGNGSIWTKRYKPISIERSEIKRYKYEEDIMTLEYMNKYGINNVRGGSFCQMILTNEEKKVIEKMIKNEENKCFKCNKNGHYVKECKEESKRKRKRKVKTV
jgi:predicted GIY-YIG superfamily endonuclease